MIISIGLCQVESLVLWAQITCDIQSWPKSTGILARKKFRDVFDFCWVFDIFCVEQVQYSYKSRLAKIDGIHLIHAVPSKKYILLNYLVKCWMLESLNLRRLSNIFIGLRAVCRPEHLHTCLASSMRSLVCFVNLLGAKVWTCWCGAERLVVWRGRHGHGEGAAASQENNVNFLLNNASCKSLMSYAYRCSGVAHYSVGDFQCRIPTQSLAHLVPLCHDLHIGLAWGSAIVWWATPIWILDHSMTPVHAVAHTSLVICYIFIGKNIGYPLPWEEIF